MVLTRHPPFGYFCFLSKKNALFVRNNSVAEEIKTSAEITNNSVICISLEKMSKKTMNLYIFFFLYKKTFNNLKVHMYI